MDEAGTAPPEGLELLGGLLRAGERTDCSGASVGVPFFTRGKVQLSDSSVEGRRGRWRRKVLLALLRGACVYPWKGLSIRLKRTSHMGCTMPSVQGMRENRLQALEAEGFELLQGALCYPWEGLVVGPKRAPQMMCVMPSVAGAQQNRLQWASVEGGAPFDNQEGWLLDSKGRPNLGWECLRVRQVRRTSPSPPPLPCKVSFLGAGFT